MRLVDRGGGEERSKKKKKKKKKKMGMESGDAQLPLLHHQVLSFYY
jgi:hypothetical protein